LVKQLLREYEDHGEHSLESAQTTFEELANFYEKTYLVEPEYIDGRKVAGLRSAYDFKLRLVILKDHFRKRKLRSITHGDIERFRTIRLQTRTRHGKQRSIATVNRELSLLRRILNVAARNGWILRNPFYGSTSLIRPGDEIPRECIISKVEEERLLSACTGLRAHLRPIIICALDSGMRRGEIFKLLWSDVNFDSRIITVRAFNTKTMRERQVPMTERLVCELESLYQLSTKEPSALCFGIYDNVKKSFASARKASGLPNVRFHDLRHTCATRLIAGGMPLPEVGRILGHTQVNTTYRYVNSNHEMTQRAANILNAFNQPNENLGKPITVIN
jgi:integrase